MTANDIAAILEYINYQYQIAYHRNKQFGSHSDFENFVGQGTIFSITTSFLIRLPPLELCGC
jgi:hypothetical protein